MRHRKGGYSATDSHPLAFVLRSAAALFITVLSVWVWSFALAHPEATDAGRPSWGYAVIAVSTLTFLVLSLVLNRMEYEDYKRRKKYGDYAETMRLAEVVLYGYSRMTPLRELLRSIRPGMERMLGPEGISPDVTAFVDEKIEPERARFLPAIKRLTGLRVSIDRLVAGDFPDAATFPESEELREERSLAALALAESLEEITAYRERTAARIAGTAHRFEWKYALADIGAANDVEMEARKLLALLTSSSWPTPPRRGGILVSLLEWRERRAATSFHGSSDDDDLVNRALA